MRTSFYHFTTLLGAQARVCSKVGQGLSPNFVAKKKVRGEVQQSVWYNLAVWVLSLSVGFGGVCPLFLSLSPLLILSSFSHVSQKGRARLGAIFWALEVVESSSVPFQVGWVGCPSRLPCLEFLPISVVSLSININIIWVFGCRVNNYFKIISIKLWFVKSIICKELQSLLIP